MRVYVLLALAGLALVTAAFLTSCGYIKAGKSSYSNPIVEHEYQAGLKVDVICEFPPLPATATVFDQLMVNTSARVGGSAVSTGATSAVTARHVVDCDLELTDGTPWDGVASQILLTTRDGTKTVAVVYEMGETRDQDIAVLQAVDYHQPPFKAWAQPSANEPTIGEEVCVMAMLPWVARKCGPVADYEEDAGWMGEGYFTYVLTSTSGNSGSGVYNSAGRLVAIHVAGSYSKDIGGGYGINHWRHMIPPF